jgi:3-carboxy-cis,cis-muconate cycloisomerase
MAHKRNPVAGVSVIACADRVPGLVATLFAGMAQEHQRAAGAWQAEWGTLTDLLTLTGSAVAWLADLLGHLEVDTAKMMDNVVALAASGATAADEAEQQLADAARLVDRAIAAVRQ